MGLAQVVGYCILLTSCITHKHYGLYIVSLFDRLKMDSFSSRVTSPG